ncbi:hypothetical protein ACSBR2_033651 [Camellia fascicularis]
MDRWPRTADMSHLGWCNMHVGRNSKTYALLKQQMEVAAKSEDFRTKEKELQAKEAELKRREQDVYMYFRGSGKAAEMKREAAKRTMMAALP